MVSFPHYTSCTTSDTVSKDWDARLVSPHYNISSKNSNVHAKHILIVMNFVSLQFSLFSSKIFVTSDRKHYKITICHMARKSIERHTQQRHCLPMSYVSYVCRCCQFTM